MAKAKCHVEFISATKRGGPAAILWDNRGRALNAMNYPRGHRFTTKEKARARARLMPGCAELSRELTKTGNVSTDTLARQRGLSGRKRRR
jgi:hypothetical protein